MAPCRDADWPAQRRRAQASPPRVSSWPTSTSARFAYRRALVGEAQIVFGDPDEAALSREASERQLGHAPAGEHEMAVGGQHLDQRSQGCLTGRARGDEVHVVDEDRHRDGLADHIASAAVVTSTSASAAPPSAVTMPESSDVADAVRRLARQPRVATRAGARLFSRRRLREAGSTCRSRRRPRCRRPARRSVGAGRGAAEVVRMTPARGEAGSAERAPPQLGTVALIGACRIGRLCQERRSCRRVPDLSGQVDDEVVGTGRAPGRRLGVQGP